MSTFCSFHYASITLAFLYFLFLVAIARNLSRLFGEQKREAQKLFLGLVFCQWFVAVLLLAPE
jgi:hypothetical protein